MSRKLLNRNRKAESMTPTVMGYFGVWTKPLNASLTGELILNHGGENTAQESPQNVTCWSEDTLIQNKLSCKEPIRFLPPSLPIWCLDLGWCCWSPPPCGEPDSEMAVLLSVAETWRIYFFPVEKKIWITIATVKPAVNLTAWSVADIYFWGSRSLSQLCQVEFGEINVKTSEEFLTDVF